jgi:hypothetical protein
MFMVVGFWRRGTRRWAVYSELLFNPTDRGTATSVAPDALGAESAHISFTGTEAA